MRAAAAASAQRNLLQSTPEEPEAAAAGPAEITPVVDAAGPGAHAVPAVDSGEITPDSTEAAGPAPAAGGLGGFMRKLTGGGRSARSSQDMEQAAREAAEAAAPPPPPAPIMVSPRALSERSERGLPPGASASPRPSPRPDIAPESVVLVTPPGGGPPIPMVPLAAMETDPGGWGHVAALQPKWASTMARFSPGEVCRSGPHGACQAASPALPDVACLSCPRPAVMAYQMGMQAGVAAAMRAGSVNASPSKAPTSGRRSVSAQRPAPPLQAAGLPTAVPLHGFRWAAEEVAQHSPLPLVRPLQNTPSRAGSISGDRPPRPRRQGSFRCASSSGSG